jgi:hypothetical protein
MSGSSVRIHNINLSMNCNRYTVLVFLKNDLAFYLQIRNFNVGIAIMAL